MRGLYARDRGPFTTDNSIDPHQLSHSCIERRSSVNVADSFSVRHSFSVYFIIDSFSSARYGHFPTPGAVTSTDCDIELTSFQRVIRVISCFSIVPLTLARHSGDGACIDFAALYSLVLLRRSYVYILSDWCLRTRRRRLLLSQSGYLYNPSVIAPNYGAAGLLNVNETAT